MNVLKVPLLFLPLSLSSNGQTIVVASDKIELDVTEYLVNIKYYYSEMNTCDEIFCSFLTESRHVFCHMNRCGMLMRVYVCDGSWMISICMVWEKRRVVADLPKGIFEVDGLSKYCLGIFCNWYQSSIWIYMWSLCIQFYC